MSGLASRILAGLQEVVEEREYIQQQMQGSSHHRGLLDDMLPRIAALVSDAEHSEHLPTYRRTRLIPLGMIPNDSFRVGNVVYQRSVYVGEDGKVYVEGPRLYCGFTVVDIHPYCVDDATGLGGLTAYKIAEMALAYFI